MSKKKVVDWKSDAGASLVEWVLIIAAVLALATIAVGAVNGLVKGETEKISKYDTPSAE